MPGELRVPLPPLDESSAVELFVDRMVVTSPDFEVERDRGSLEELCRRLDGFPLALELAAARCRTLTPGQLLGAAWSADHSCSATRQACSRNVTVISTG